MNNKSTKRILSLIVALMLLVIPFSTGVAAQEPINGEVQVATSDVVNIEADQPGGDFAGQDGLKQPVEPPSMLSMDGPVLDIGTGGDSGSYAVPYNKPQVDASARIADARSGSNRQLEAAGTPLVVGSTVTVNNLDDSLGGYPTYQAEVIAASTDAVVLLDKTLSTSIFNGVKGKAAEIESQINDIMATFSDPSKAAYIGKPYYLSGWSQRVKIVLTDINRDGTSSGGYTAGYFWGLDYLQGTYSVTGLGNRTSNYDAVIYVDVGQNQGYSRLSQGYGNRSYDEFFGTIAHEYQHLVNFGASVRIAGGDPDDAETQSLWMNEGLSGMVDTYFTGMMTTSHMEQFLNQKFRATNGYVVTQGQWNAANNLVYANYGAAASLLFEYLQYHALGAGMGSQPYDLINDSDRGSTDAQKLEVAKSTIARHFWNDGKSFNDFFELAALDMAVGNPIDPAMSATYSAMQSAGINVYATYALGDNPWNSRSVLNDGFNSNYAGVSKLSPNTQTTVNSNSSTYMTRLYLADTVGAANNAAKITIPQSSNAKYFVIHPYNRTGVNNDTLWEDAAKMAKVLTPGENTVSVGVDNRFAVLMVNFGSTVTGDRISYVPASTATINIVNSTVTGLSITGEPGTIALNLTTDQIPSGTTIDVKVLKASDSSEVSGITATGFQVAADGTSSGIVTIPGLNPGAYKVRMTANDALRDLDFGVSAKGTLSAPTGTSADPNSQSIEITFDTAVSLQGGVITLGASSGDSFVAQPAAGTKKSATVSVPVARFNSQSTGDPLVLLYDETYTVSIDAAFVVDAESVENIADTVGSFTVADEPSQPSAIPNKLNIFKGEMGAFAVYFGKTVTTGDAAISVSNTNIITVDTQDVSASGTVVGVNAKNIGSAKITIGYSSGEEETVNVTVTNPDGGTGGGTVTITGGSVTRGTGTGSGSGKGGTRDTYGAGTTAGAPLSQTAAVTSAQNAIKAAQAADSTTASARFTNVTDVPLSVMKAMADEAAKAKIKLTVVIDTVENGAVVLRQSFDPSLATKDVTFGGSAGSANAANVTSVFAKYFSNKISVFGITEPVDYGMPMGIALKADLTGLDNKALIVSSYNSAVNNYRQATNSCWIDKNGYLHFSTEMAGSYVVSDKALARK